MDGDANVFKMYEVRVVILITPIRIPGINDATGTPVSYTHLDVYKRQVLELLLKK